MSSILENMIIRFICLMKWILNWMIRLVGLDVSLNGLDEMGYWMYVERARPYSSVCLQVWMKMEFLPNSVRLQKLNSVFLKPHD